MASVPGELVYDTTLKGLSVRMSSTWETVDSYIDRFKITIDHTKVSGTNNNFIYLFSDQASSFPPENNDNDPCSGGTKTHDGDYVIRKFTSSGTLSCSAPLNVEVLVVGGGGAGGTWCGGGGGGGGVIYNASYSASGSITVTVGAGGAKPAANGTGASGQNSIFGTLTAHGGGGGGGYPNAGSNGASGGGGCGGGSLYNVAGGTATPGGEGYNGGSGGSSGAPASGGGGGGGAVGVTGGPSFGGVGGDGLPFTIYDGTTRYYGGGGGGWTTGYTTTGALGGQGGGGNGSSGDSGGSVQASDGTANTGGGGGGAWYNNYGYNGGGGGSGVVIVRYYCPRIVGPNDKFWTYTSAQNIRFFDTDGTTELKREIVLFDGVNHSVEAWVQIPSLSSGSDKVIYCQYGGTTKANDTSLWTDAGYIAVYHLKNMTNPITSSTGTVEGTNYNSNATAITGIIGSGGYFNGSATTYIDLGNQIIGSFGNHKISITAWINPQQMVKNSLLCFRNGYDSNGGARYGFHSASNRLGPNYILFWGDNTGWIHSTSAYPMGSWLYEGWTVDGTAFTFYGNGNADGTATLGATWDPAGAGMFDSEIGRCNWGSAGGAECAYGILDEVRIANVTLGADQIKTEYNNQSDPSTFSTCSNI